MPTFHSGVGGKLTIGGTDLEVANWSYNENARLAEVTNSASGGLAVYIDTVTEVSWTCEGPWDSTALPDTDVGAIPGTQAALVLTFGNSTKTMTLADTVVESLAFTVDTVGGTSIRFTASGKGTSGITRATT